MEWLKDKGCSITNDAHIEALENGNEEIIEWLNNI